MGPRRAGRVRRLQRRHGQLVVLGARHAYGPPAGPPGQREAVGGHTRGRRRTAFAAATGSAPARERAVDDEPFPGHPDHGHGAASGSARPDPLRTCATWRSHPSPLPRNRLPGLLRNAYEHHEHRAAAPLRAPTTRGNSTGHLRPDGEHDRQIHPFRDPRRSPAATVGSLPVSRACAAVALSLAAPSRRDDGITHCAFLEAPIWVNPVQWRGRISGVELAGLA